MRTRWLLIAALGSVLSGCEKRQETAAASGAGQTLEAVNSGNPATSAPVDASVAANQIQIPDYPPLDADLARSTGAHLASPGQAAPAIAPKERGTSTDLVAFDPRNSTFKVNGQTVSLKNGISSVPSAPGSASAVTTRDVGKVARGDLNHDGQQDIAFIVTQEAGGSGLFYYAVAALNVRGGYRLTNAFLIGDRILPQSIAVPRNSDEIQIKFAERRQGEPMTAPPSVASVVLLKVSREGVLEGLLK